MPKAIRKICNNCEGTRYVEKEICCGECRGDGRQVEEIKENCPSCFGTGRYIKRRVAKDTGELEFHFVTCRRCDGQGGWPRKRLSEKTCPKCGGKGKIRIRVRCRDCRGKGRVILNRMAEYWPRGDRKLRV